MPDRWSEYLCEQAVKRLRRMAIELSDPAILALARKFEERNPEDFRYVMAAWRLLGMDEDGYSAPIPERER